MWITRKEYQNLITTLHEAREKDLLRISELEKELAEQKSKFNKFHWEVKHPPKYEIGYKNKNFLITDRRLGIFTMSDYRTRSGAYTEYYWEYIIFDSRLNRAMTWTKESALLKELQKVVTK